MSTVPVGIAEDLFVAAQECSQMSGRSAAQKMSYWARIGHELEMVSAINQRDIERVLADDEAYDALSEREQAIVRARWEERIEARRSALNFEDEFTAEGRPWMDADAKGALVPGGPLGEA